MIKMSSELVTDIFKCIISIMSLFCLLYTVIFRWCIRTTSIPASPSILFHSIVYSTIHTIICFKLLFCYFCVFFILILFLLSVCRCCLCELEAYDIKTNSLHTQAYLAIKALSDSELSIKYTANLTLI